MQRRPLIPLLDAGPCMLLVVVITNTGLPFLEHRGQCLLRGRRHGRDRHTMDEYISYASVEHTARDAVLGENQERKLEAQTR